MKIITRNSPRNDAEKRNHSDDPYQFSIRWNSLNELVLKLVQRTDEWKHFGYNGISDIVYKELGFKVVRDKTDWVTFVFDSSEDYVAFALKNGIP